MYIYISNEYIKQYIKDTDIDIEIYKVFTNDWHLWTHKNLKAKQERERQ